MSDGIYYEAIGRAFGAMAGLETDNRRLRELLAGLASFSPTFVDHEGNAVCNYCGHDFVELPHSRTSHHDDCPWFAAKKWLEEHPA